MITELALHSGGDCEVVLLVDCKGTELPNSMDTVAMDKFKADYLPRELGELAVFFNTKILEAWYPKIKAHEYVHYASPSRFSFQQFDQRGSAVFPVSPAFFTTSSTIRIHVAI